MKQQFLEEHNVVGNNDLKAKEDLIKQVVTKSEEEYGKKRLGYKRMKFTREEGALPRVRSLPEIHKRR
jgi:hypothetical protein